MNTLCQTCLRNLFFLAAALTAGFFLAGTLAMLRFRAFHEVNNFGDGGGNLQSLLVA